MLDYIFFDPVTCERFQRFVEQRGLSARVESDPVNEHVRNIRISDEIDEALWDEIDAYYDGLLDDSREELEAETGEEDLRVAGIHVELEDGRRTLARVDPAIMGKLMGVLSGAEISDLVHAVARSVEHPDDTPICKRSYAEE